MSTENFKAFSICESSRFKESSLKMSKSELIYNFKTFQPWFFFTDLEMMLWQFSEFLWLTTCAKSDHWFVFGFLIDWSLEYLMFVNAKQLYSHSLCQTVMKMNKMKTLLCIIVGSPYVWNIPTEFIISSIEWLFPSESLSHSKPLELNVIKLFNAWGKIPRFL